MRGAIRRAGHKQSVGIQPADVAFGCRHVKATLHEGAGLDVELAVAVSVAAVGGGERNYGQAVLGAVGRTEEADTMEDPLNAFGGGKASISSRTSHSGSSVR